MFSKAFEKIVIWKKNPVMLTPWIWFEPGPLDDLLTIVVWSATSAIKMSYTLR